MSRRPTRPPGRSATGGAPGPDDPRKCTAHRSNGQPCGKWAIAGGNVCGTHGGSAPQVRQKAKLRLLEALDPASAELVRIATAGENEAVRVRAITEIMDRAGMPKETKVEHTGSGGGPLALTIEELRRIAEETQDDEEEPAAAPRAKKGARKA